MYTHAPVLTEAVLEHLGSLEGVLCADVTLGAGGHTRAIEAQGGVVIGTDRDPSVFQRAWGSTRVFHARFSQWGQLMDQLGVRPKHVLADLGVSSMQLDDPLRGFRFTSPHPLDLRMNPQEGEPAYQLLEEVSLSELIQILGAGGVPFPKPVAKAIFEAKPKTCEELSLVVTKWSRRFFSKSSEKHPATLVFQALRMHVNQELYEIETLIKDVWARLPPGGRLCIITFHSLEDQCVKRNFRELIRPHTLPRLPTLPQPSLGIMYTPVYPTEAEIAQNPRARSAKLRVLQKAEVS